MMYDLIGDIHGYAIPLKKLLGKMGYHEKDGVWQHPDRKVIFLGDFIDRGPEQVESVSIARLMVENGCALAVMGNHEFNAVAWAAPDLEREGAYLREHSQKNLRQHKAFLDEVGQGSALHARLLEWFHTLPVYLDLDGLRVVHACWDPPSLDVIDSYTDDQNRILPDAWPELTRKGTPGFAAVETLLKGLEVPLPRGLTFNDRNGHERTHMRARWWHDGEELTYRDLAMVPSEAIHTIPHEPVATDILPGYAGDKPVFVGHYWLSGDPEPLTDHIACLDYSIAAEHIESGARGKLCAYRWNGEKTLSRNHFVWVS